MEIHNRDKIEQSFARRMSRLSTKHRKEFERLIGSPPKISNVPASFWKMVEEDVESALAAMLLLIFMESATQHGAAFKDVKPDAMEWSSSRATQVAGLYVQTSKKKAREIVKRLREESTKSSRDGQFKSNAGSKGSGNASSDSADRKLPSSTTASGLSPKTITQETLKVFGPARATSVAVSETTNAATSGSEAAIRRTVGFHEKDYWFTRSDGKVCKICQPLHHKPRSVWSNLYPEGPGPEVHPDCRCWINYASERRRAGRGSKTSQEQQRATA